MQARLLSLLLVSPASGSIAGTGVTAASGVARATPAARAPASSPGFAVRTCPRPARYRGAFTTAARDTRLPLALLVAVGRVESNLGHDAVSEAGGAPDAAVLAYVANVTTRWRTLNGCA